MGTNQIIAKYRSPTRSKGRKVIQRIKAQGSALRALERFIKRQQKGAQS